MKKFLLLAFTILIVLSGCGKKKARNAVEIKDYENEVEKTELMASFSNKYNDFKLRFLDSDFIVTLDYETVKRDYSKTPFGNADIIDTSKDKGTIKFDKDNQVLYVIEVESEGEKLNGVQQYLREEKGESKAFSSDDVTYVIDLIEKDYELSSYDCERLVELQANQYYQEFTSKINNPRSNESSIIYNGEIKYYLDDYIYTSVIETNRSADNNDKRDIYERGVAQVIIEDNAIIFNYNYKYTYDESGIDWSHKKEETQTISIKIELKNQKLEKEDLSNYRFDD